MLFGDQPESPPWYTNRLLLRLLALPVGVLGAILWPSVKQLWYLQTECAQLFSQSEIEALVGHEVERPFVHHFDSDYFEVCEADFGVPRAFSVDLSAGRGTTKASYGFSGHLQNLDAVDPNVVVEPAPEVDPRAWVAIADRGGGYETITVLIERPLDGSIEISHDAPGKVTPEVRRRFLDAVIQHLPKADAFFEG
ncbi:hypothetical protein LBMAG42_33860 [Deltaproteobacteria bacterium]|nr:hypothetical protein LBMAG42_33860 [Deltaproteobacteria bacterium]